VPKVPVCYPTDISDDRWAWIEPMLPDEKPGGRPRETELRSVFNALLYMNRSGCQWAMLPKEYPPKSTVYGYFKEWSEGGYLEEIATELRQNVRIKAGRNAKPSAAIIDSQTQKTALVSESVGYDAGKKLKGRKRHIAVDVLGLILIIIVHSAGIQDRAGAKLVFQRLARAFTVQRIWADGGYSGSALRDWVLMMCNAILEVVKRPRKKFQIVKWRWIVERTFGWLNFYRRLSKDYEYYCDKEVAWIQLASIDIMLKRLA